LKFDLKAFLIRGTVMPQRIEKIHNEERLKVVRRALRNNATSAEGTLWRYLKRSQLRGRKFRRQHSIGAYIVDFYCPAEKFAIELDGEAHNDPGRREYDDEREAYLREQGIRIVRFENKEVFKNAEIVLQAIAWHFGE